MSPARAFLSVPPDDLTVIDLRASAKHGRAEIDTWMREVPEVQRRLLRGWSAADFDRLRRFPQGSRERIVGEVHRHLYDPRGGHGRLRASVVGGRLIVDDGRHRVARARRLGLPTVPVEVACRDPRGLAAVRRRYPPALPERVRTQQRETNPHHAAGRHEDRRSRQARQQRATAQQRERVRDRGR